MFARFVYHAHVHATVSSYHATLVLALHQQAYVGMPVFVTNASASEDFDLAPGVQGCGDLCFNATSRTKFFGKRTQVCARLSFDHLAMRTVFAFNVRRVAQHICPRDSGIIAHLCTGYNVSAEGACCIAGFTSVMIDLSQLASFREDNLALLVKRGYRVSLHARCAPGGCFLHSMAYNTACNTKPATVGCHHVQLCTHPVEMRLSLRKSEPSSALVCCTGTPWGATSRCWPALTMPLPYRTLCRLQSSFHPDW